MRSVRSEIRHQLAALFEEEGIVIAFPQRNIHFDASKPIPVSVAQTLDAHDD